MVREKMKKITTKIVTIATAFIMISPQIVVATRFTQSVTSRDPSSTSGSGKTVVVLDPGHGKSSGSMSDSEKTSEGFVQDSSGSWGEWRHWKDGTYGESCQGNGCSGPKGNGCWYGIGGGDREDEPTINLNNANAAKKYLEQMGYEVRMTRTSNEQNPSFTKRASYCFPNNDTSKEPDSELYVCIHSNASTNDSKARKGTVRGTSYIKAEGTYTQKYMPSDYVDRSNKAADIINKKVSTASGIKENSPLTGQGYLIAFNKNPVPTAYLEIGFFDNTQDYDILQSKSDEIGKAIAEGIDEYLKSVDPLTSGSRGSGTSGSSTAASKGRITISSNEGKFLGLWKNSVGYYVPYYQDPDKAKFNPDGKEVGYSFYGYPVDVIFQTEQWLFDVLSVNPERTQQSLQLLKYLMYKYSRKGLWSNRI